MRFTLKTVMPALCGLLVHFVPFVARGSIPLTTLASFNEADGTYPNCGLVQGKDGNFYGTTSFGGTSNQGTLFLITPAGTLTRLYSFTGGPDGGSANAPLVQGSDTNFYGTTTGGGTNGSGTVFKITSGGTFISLYSFTGGNDGQFPSDALVQGSDGNFYGDTEYGGTNRSGAVFKITPGGALTPLYSFPGTNDIQQPQQPLAALILGKDLNFYGTTLSGGTNGNGAVFKITPGGSLTRLYSFTGGRDGGGLKAALVLGNDGNFYGTTPSLYGRTNNGTVFKITPSGNFATLYSFTGGNDGANPFASLVQGSDGNFYGTTRGGGTNGQGTIFQITPGGLLTTLYSFSGSNDGGGPVGALVRANDGDFYGTTRTGGTNGYGTVFRMAPPTPPSIINQPTGQVARSGATISFSVLAAGSAPLSYQWRLNGTNLVDDPRTTGSASNLLTIASVQLSDSGLYTVLVSNLFGSVTSAPPASLLVRPVNDDFANAIQIVGSSATVSGSNVNATKEPGELNHANNPGGASVWWKWTAPANGKVTLDSSGSTFNPLLAVYTGNTFSSFLSVASSLFSPITFNVTAGITYFIAVDGVNNGSGPAEGSITLSLSECFAPQILDFTTTQTNQLDGIHIHFCPDVIGNVTQYFWSIQSGQTISNSSTHEMCFDVVVAPTNEVPVVVSLNATGPCGGANFGSTPVTSCGICLSHGVPSVHQDATGSGSGPLLTNKCGVLNSSARWFKLTATDGNGFVTVSTAGSSNGTTLAVYTGSLYPLNLALVACTNRPGPVTFSAAQCTTTLCTVYWILVEPPTTGAGFQLTSAFVKYPVTVTGLTANNKVYDGTTSATISSNNVSLIGVTASDAANVSLSTNGYSASFATAAVGTAKAVTVTGLTLTGGAAANYSLNVPTNLSANITAATVTVASGLVANSKVYDGTTSATISSNNASLRGVLAADAANVFLSTNGYSATFATAAVGTAKTVTITGLTLTGSAATNYTLTPPTASADITLPALRMRAPVLTNGMLSVTIDTAAGAKYFLQFKTSLNDMTWTAVGQSIIGDGSSKLLSDPTPTSASRFYRILVQPQ